MKEILYSVVGAIFFAVAMFIGILSATSKSTWYAGMHDSQHEGSNCHCYERFMEKNGR